MQRNGALDNLGPLLFLVIILCSAGVAAAPARVAAPPSPAEATARLETFERNLLGGEVSADELDQAIARSAAFATQGNECAADRQAELEQLNSSIASLGGPQADEPKLISQERAQLLKRRTELEKEIAECRVLALKADAVLGKLDRARQALFTHRLLRRHPDLVAIVADWLDAPPDQWRTAGRFLVAESGVAQISLRLRLLLAALLLAGLAAGFWLRGLCRRRCTLPLPTSLAGRLGRNLLITAGRDAPALAAILVVLPALALFSAGLRPAPYLPAVLATVAGYLLVRVTVRAILVPGRSGEPLPSSWPEEECRRLSRRLLASVKAGLALFLLHLPPLTAALPSSFLALLQLLAGTLLGLALLRLAWLVKQLPKGGRHGRHLRLFAPLLIALILLADWLGYRDLAAYLAQGIAGTLLLGLLLLATHAVVERLFVVLTQGRGAAGTAHRPMASLIWGRIIVGLLLWVFFLLALLRIWGLASPFVRQLYTLLWQGIPLGTFTLVPIRIATGLITFTALWTLSSWLRRRMDDDWLGRTQLPSSTQEAMVTVSGYIGFGLALLIGLSVAGVDFTGLAVIAGALSVGIGFGLQNIVNNFVSGLILLFEQPVKKGDWVRVGDTEGYVQKISVRSTIIQTFDRADVIVPNSDLIASPVTNLMLHDQFGRVRVAVGVAYGSDTALVNRLLLEIAHQHPLVVTDGSAPMPQAIFVEFGDSSLNFELRCFIRDINQIFTTRSDLNFAIDASFRANGVQIPFPQRDLHILDLPPKETR